MTKKEKRRFRKLLREMDDKELVVTWANTVKSYYYFKNTDAPDHTDIIRAMIYRRGLLDSYIEAVDNLGVLKMLRPWYIIQEHLFYDFGKSGQCDDDIRQRIRNNNLKAYIELIVVPKLAKPLQNSVREEDVDRAVKEIEYLLR